MVQVVEIGDYRLQRIEMQVTEILALGNVRIIRPLSNDIDGPWFATIRGKDRIG
jgi:hypothetical protein